MLPMNRPPTTPGEMLLEEFLKPRRISQVDLAARMDVPVQRVNTIVNGKRGITAETAILLSEALDTTPEFWMGVQADHDLWHALRKRGATKKRGVLATARGPERRPHEPAETDQLERLSGCGPDKNRAPIVPIFTGDHVMRSICVGRADSHSPRIPRKCNNDARLPAARSRTHNPKAAGIKSRTRN